MTFCLFECLRAVGLQSHYSRFISAGVRRLAHLSALTMEDYPMLGIRSMEDRTQLFHLVQMFKTLDQDNLEYDDGDEDEDEDDYDADAAADSSLIYEDCGDSDENIYDDEDVEGASGSRLNAASFSKPPCVRRQLDFGCKTNDHHKKLFSNPVSRRVNNHRLDVYSHQSDPLTEASTKPGIMEEISMSNSLTGLSPKYAPFHKPKPRPTTGSSKGFSNASVGHKASKGVSKREKYGSNGAFEHMAKPAPVYESKRTAGYNYGLPLSLPSASNKQQSGGQRISVCVRKRPLTRTECSRGEPDVVSTPRGECVVVHESKQAVDLTEYILQHRFYFDQVFGEESSNEEVYGRTALPLVQHMLHGGKATCFAYGQTGAGKTHTMLGSSPQRPGLYTLAARDIFAHLSTTPKHTALWVYVSFFEIYCGQMYDLLDHRKRLFAREDGQKVVHIAGLRHVRVDSVGSILEVISQGTEERTQGTSGVNPLSSRSHALLQIQLRDLKQEIAGRMWFVDLAGSERASDTSGSDRQSRMEGAEINQSLLALKECIRSLDQEQSHTPFRQSKLTQVLKDSFVGDSKTCMIANISPGHLATEHTLNTLRYADRVKELRGHGRLRGGRRGRTTQSPKRNLSNSSSSSSSVGIRGKSPPKKLKLVRQREAFGPRTTCSTNLTTEDSILCSTPKNGRLGKEASARARTGVELEQISPIRSFVGMSDKRERASEREGRRKERYGAIDLKTELIFGQAADEEVDLLVQRESEFYHRERRNLQSTMEGRREWDRIPMEPRRQVENSTDAPIEVERIRQRDFQKVDERDKERKTHLRQYHQQLQKYMPSPVHHASSSTCPSFSSSNKASLSSSISPSPCSSLRHTSRLSFSDLINHGLEEVLDAYRAESDGNGGQLSFVSYKEICDQTKTSPSYNKNKLKVSHGGSGSTGEDWRVSLNATEARFEQDGGKNEKRKSRKNTAEGEVKVRTEGRGHRERARVAETEHSDGTTGAWPPVDLEALLSYSRDTEERRVVGDQGTDDSDVPAVGVWSAEERRGADGYIFESTHRNNDSNGLFDHSLAESPDPRAPAERPLSPACEHPDKPLIHYRLGDQSPKLTHSKSSSDVLPLPSQNAQQEVPSRSCKKKEPLFDANITRRDFSNAKREAQLTSPNTQNRLKIPNEALNILSNSLDQPKIKAKMAVLPQAETTTDYVSYNMDPLSISLLQVDQEVATASFLQGEQNSCSLFQLENDREGNNRRNMEKRCLPCAEMAGKVVQNEDVEFRLSLLELPQVKTHSPVTTDTKTDANHTRQRKDMCFGTHEHCEIGMMKSVNPKDLRVFLQDQENIQKPKSIPAVKVLADKAAACPLKPSTCDMPTSNMQSISSVNLFGNTGSPSSHDLRKNGTITPPEYTDNVHDKFASYISTPMSESVLGQLNTMPKQCNTALSNQCSNLNVSLQPNGSSVSNSRESTRNQQIRPKIHLSTLGDLDYNQWRVVQAHWEQLEEMEALFCKEGTLLCQQPEMAFGEYVYKLEEIMDRKAQCVHSMIAQLQPYLTPSNSNKPKKQSEDES